MPINCPCPQEICFLWHTSKGINAKLGARTRMCAHTHTHTTNYKGEGHGGEGLRSAKCRWRWARPMCYVFIMYGAALNFQKDSCGPETADKHTRRAQLFHLGQTLITDAGRHGTLIVGHAIISSDATWVLPSIIRRKRAASRDDSAAAEAAAERSRQCDLARFLMNKASVYFIYFLA